MQTGLDGVTPIDVMPAFLVVPTALEMVAAQIVTAVTPAVSTSVTPEFVRSLRVISEPRLDADSAIRYYLFAAPGTIDTFEYGHLDGAQGVQMEEVPQTTFEGLTLQALLDFGAKAIDWRGMVRSSGA